MLQDKRLNLIILVSLSLILISSAVCAAQKTELAGIMIIEDDIVTFVTAGDELKLQLIQTDLLTEETFPLHQEGEYILKGYVTDKGFIAYELTTPDREHLLKEESGKPLMLSTSPELRYIVETRRCISCRICVRYCPVGAIRMVRGAAVIDEEKCISCGICIDGNARDFSGCPVDAIKTEPRE